MRVFNILFFLSFLSLSSFGQKEVEKIYNKAMEAYQKQNFKEAVELIDKCIKMDSTISNFWYNRGVFNSKQKEFQVSINDFSKAINITPENKTYFNARGNSRQDIKDYNGAISDYNKALLLDSNYTDAYWNKAETYDKLNDIPSACYCYKKASLLNDNESLDRLNYYRQNKLINDTTLNIVEYSTDTTYGYSETNPIEVGCNIYTGPQSQRYFLDQLYDSYGNKIEYKRLQSCCQHPSESGILGFALLDVYEITTKDSKNNPVKFNLYICMWCYHKPLVPYHFKKK